MQTLYLHDRTVDETVLFDRKCFERRKVTQIEIREGSKREASDRDGLELWTVENGADRSVLELLRAVVVADTQLYQTVHL